MRFFSSLVCFLKEHVVQSRARGRTLLGVGLCCAPILANALPLQGTTFASVLAEPDSIDVIIDSVLPNTVPVQGGKVADVPPTAFTDAGIGLIATGQVGDWTSAQVTSDFYTNGTTVDRNGAPITSTIEWTFVNPDAPSFDATVQKLGFRFGSTLANDVRVNYYDVDGVLLGGQTLPAATTGSIGVEVKPGETTGIHSAVFTTIGVDDLYVIGSFTLPTDSIDITFSGFVADQPVPAPASLLLLLTGLLLVARTGREKRDQEIPSKTRGYGSAGCRIVQPLLA